MLASWWRKNPEITEVSRTDPRGAVFIRLKFHPNPSRSWQDILVWPQSGGPMETTLSPVACHLQKGRRKLKRKKGRTPVKWITGGRQSGRDNKSCWGLIESPWACERAHREIQQDWLWAQWNLGPLGHWPPCEINRGNMNTRLKSVNLMSSNWYSLGLCECMYRTISMFTHRSDCSSPPPFSFFVIFSFMGTKRFKEWVNEWLWPVGWDTAPLPSSQQDLQL